MIPTLVQSVSRNDNIKSKRRIRQRGKALSSHIRFPLLTKREEREYLTSNCLSTFKGIITFYLALLYRLAKPKSFSKG